MQHSGRGAPKHGKPFCAPAKAVGPLVDRPVGRSAGPAGLSRGRSLDLSASPSNGRSPGRAPHTIRACIGRKRPGTGQCCPNLAEFAPNVVEFQPVSAKRAQNWPESRRKWPDSPKIGRNGHGTAQHRQDRPNLGQSRPLRQMCPCAPARFLAHGTLRRRCPEAHECRRRKPLGKRLNRLCRRKICRGTGLAFSLFGTAPTKTVTGQTFSRDPAARDSSYEHFGPTVRKRQSSARLARLARNRSNSLENWPNFPETGRTRPGIVVAARIWWKSPRVGRARPNQPHQRSRSARNSSRLPPQWPETLKSCRNPTIFSAQELCPDGHVDTSGDSGRRHPRGGGGAKANPVLASGSSTTDCSIISNWDISRHRCSDKNAQVVFTTKTDWVLQQEHWPLLLNTNFAKMPEGSMGNLAPAVGGILAHVVGLGPNQSHSRPIQSSSNQSHSVPVPDQVCSKLAEIGPTWAQSWSIPGQIGRCWSKLCRRCLPEVNQTRPVSA